MILHWTNFIKCTYWKSNSSVKLVLSGPLVWVFIITSSPAIVLKQSGLEEQTLCEELHECGIKNQHALEV